VLMMRLDGEPIPAIASTLRADEHDITRRLDRLVARVRPRLVPHEALWSG